MAEELYVTDEVVSLIPLENSPVRGHFHSNPLAKAHIYVRVICDLENIRYITCIVIAVRVGCGGSIYLVVVIEARLASCFSSQSDDLIALPYSPLQYVDGHNIGILPWVTVNNVPRIGGLYTNILSHPSSGHLPSGTVSVLAAVC